MSKQIVEVESKEFYQVMRVEQDVKITAVGEENIYFTLTETGTECYYKADTDNEIVLARAALDS